MTKISAIILAKNEENRIKDCLESLAFCSEIILVDNGSTDETALIAKKQGALVISSDTLSFAELRNIGLKKALGDWVLYVDADERVTSGLEQNILKAVSSNSEFHAFTIERENYYLGNHKWPVTERLERLFIKKYLLGWYGELHESPRVEGKIGKLDGVLRHYSHRTLTEMLNKTIVWSDVEARLRLDSRHPKISWWRLYRVTISGFWNSYISQNGWKAGTAGLVESIYQAFSMFITYAKLWELQQKLNQK